MITLIEIFDTAVKIGLGAAISGIAAYWVSREKNSHDISRLQMENRMAVLREVAEKHEESKALLNEFVFGLNFGRQNLDDNLAKAYIISSKSHALANMLNLTDLSLAINEYSRQINELCKIQCSLPSSKTIEFNSNIELVNEKKDRVEFEIAAAYTGLSA